MDIVINKSCVIDIRHQESGIILSRVDIYCIEVCSIMYHGIGDVGVDKSCIVNKLVYGYHKSIVQIIIYKHSIVRIVMDKYAVVVFHHRSVEQIMVYNNRIILREIVDYGVDNDNSVVDWIV